MPRRRGGPLSAKVDRVVVRSSRLVFAVAAIVLNACSAAPPPAPVVAEAPAPEPVDRGASSVESEIGGMNEEAVDRTFGTLKDPILKCVEDRAAHVKELGGHFQLALRVDQAGRAVSAYLSESTIGDRETERCILDLALGTTWPKPLGGQGLAERSFDVDPPREPIMWDEKKVKRAVSTVASGLRRCRRGASGQFVATAYVRPNGRVLAAGVAPPSAGTDEAVDCIVDTIQKMHFASPGSRSAKVTFAVP
jgi:hypothetical protein